MTWNRILFLVLGLLSAAAVHARELHQLHSTVLPVTTVSRRSRGQITLVGTSRDPVVNQQLSALLALPAPEPLTSSSGDSSSNTIALAKIPQGPVVPTAKATIKRVFFKNNCTCNRQTTFPVIALSYKPVQSADFYTIGYWELKGCQSRYLIATTWGTVGIWGEMSDKSTTWAGNVPLRVYNPAEDQCESRKKNFIAYDMPDNWDDYTVMLNCN